MSNPPEFQVTSGGAIAVQAPVSVVRKSPGRLFWERLRQDKAALGGGVVIVLLVLTGIFGGPLAVAITGHGQNEVFDQMTDAYGIPPGRTGTSSSARTPRAATSSCARCTARAPRSSSASSQPPPRC